MAVSTSALNARYFLQRKDRRLNLSQIQSKTSKRDTPHTKDSLMMNKKWKKKTPADYEEFVK